MGPELAAAAPYVFAGGTAASLLGQQQQAREQRRILNRAMDQTDRDQARAASEALAESQTMRADNRAQSMQDEQQSAFERLQADLHGAGAYDATQDGRGMSSAYQRLSGERDAQEADRMTAVARELANVRGVGSLQQNEAMRRGAMAERLGSMWNSNRARTQAAGMDAESTGMPLYGQLGNIAQLVGGVGMLAGGPATSEAAAGVAGNPGMIATDQLAGPAAAPSVWPRAVVLGSPMFSQRGGVFGGKRP